MNDELKHIRDYIRQNADCLSLEGKFGVHMSVTPQTARELVALLERLERESAAGEQR